MKIGAVGALLVIVGTACGRATSTPTGSDPQVDAIEISPQNATLAFGGRVVFAAAAYNRAHTAIPGVRVAWSAFDEAHDLVAKITSDGDFTPVVPGMYRVTAAYGGHSATTTLVVPEPQLNSSVSSSAASSYNNRFASTAAPQLPICLVSRLPTALMAINNDGGGGYGDNTVAAVRLPVNRVGVSPETRWGPKGREPIPRNGHRQAARSQPSRRRARTCNSPPRSWICLGGDSASSCPRTTTLASGS